MSDSFTSSTTKTFAQALKEIETKLSSKDLDIFTQDFSPPGAAEQVPGLDFTKNDNGYQDKHSDYSSDDSNSLFNRSMAAAGPASYQKPLDDLDEEIQKENAPIKNYDDQFPGDTLDQKVERKLKRLREPASEVAEFDPHLTDPMRLSMPQTGSIISVLDPRQGHDIRVRVQRVVPSSYESVGYYIRAQDPNNDIINVIWSVPKSKWIRHGKISV